VEGLSISMYVRANSFKSARSLRSLEEGASLHSTGAVDLNQTIIQRLERALKEISRSRLAFGLPLVLQGTNKEPTTF
jgi:hypothetical protein